MSTLGIAGFIGWLITVWVLLWGDLSIANVLSGFLVAVVILVVARLPRLRRTPPDQRIRINPLLTIWFGVFVLVKLWQATLTVAWAVVMPRPRIHTGVIAVPLRTESETVMMIVANVITLTPGTITLDAVGMPPVLYVHVLDLREIERVRTELLKIEEMSVRAFGSPAMREDLARSKS
jgi:multicomponent Na+:H+ antiporter subunit E